MTAVGFLARAALRRQWRNLLVLLLLVGVAGAVVMGAVAGARRTASALGRFEEQSRSAHAEINVGDPTADQLREFGRAEGVGEVAVLRQLALQYPGHENLPVGGARDERFGRLLDRARMVAGRRANPAVIDEVAIGEALADQLGVGVGDRLGFESYTQQQIEVFFGGGDGGAPAGPRVQLRVVGIERRPLDLGARGARGGVVVPTPAFVQAYADRIGSFSGDILRVRARHGAADLPRVTAAARRIFGGSPVYAVQPLGVETEGARDAIDVLAVALWTFGAIAGLAGLVAIAIVMSRQVALISSDEQTLRALGLSRRQRVVTLAAAAVPVGVGGAVLAVLGAVLASPLLPFGVARRAEPDPGFRLDWTVLGLGALALLVVVASVAVLGAIRVTGKASSAAQASPTAAGFAIPAAMLRSFPPSPSIGLRMAFEPGRGRTAVPVRSAFIGAVVGALGVVAVLTFASSLNHLVTTPASYGWTWDLKVDDEAVRANAALACQRVETRLTREPSLEALTATCDLTIEIDGRPVIGYGFAPLRGSIGATVVAGRAPRGPDEIALGTSTLETLNKRVGDRVRVSGESGTSTYRVVGRVVLPPQGPTSDPQPLADGATFTGAGLGRLSEPGGEGTTDFLVRIAPDADAAAVTRRIDARPGLSLLAQRPEVPVEVDRVRQVDWLPTVLAAFMGMLAVVAVGHALVTAVGRRRSDLAVLKTLGFSRLQVRATVAWQATALSVAGLAVGVPLGLVAGRTVWRLVADGLGVSTTATVPVLGVLATVVGGIALANLTAALPARAAARTQPAVVLRSE